MPKKCTKEPVEKKAKRDSKGRWQKGCTGNPNAKNIGLVKKVQNTRTHAAKYIVDERGFEILKKHAEDADPKISLPAVQFLIQLFVPKLRPSNLVSPKDLPQEAQDKLKALSKMAPEKQAREAINLYIDGVINEGIASTLSELIKAAQHVQDERIEALLAKFGIEEEEEK